MMRAVSRAACLLVATVIALDNTAQAIDIVAFSTDFESGLPDEMSLGESGTEGWAVEAIPMGNPEGVESGFPPKSFTEFGFSADNWLTSTGGGKGLTTSPTDDPNPPNDGSDIVFKTATLELSELPFHESIDLNFLFAVTDSIDRGNRNDRTDGPFVVRVDGEEIFRVGFQNSGGFDANGNFPEGITDEIDENARLVQNENLTANLRFPDDDPANAPHNWTLDSGFDLGVISAFNEIPHSASTLTVEFMHSVGSGNGDEAHAIDDLEVILNNAGGTLGDVNGDDVVDAEDFEVIRQNLLQAATSVEEGDVNFDGFVDLEDFRVWKDNRTDGASASATVPEPATYALIALLTGSVLVYRRFRRR